MNNSHFNRIDRRLSDIEKNIIEIKNGVKRNDTHISFVTKLYLSMRKPMLKFVKYIGYELDEKSADENHEDRFTETELNIVIENNSKKFLLQDEIRMMNLV